MLNSRRFDTFFACGKFGSVITWVFDACQSQSYHFQSQRSLFRCRRHGLSLTLCLYYALGHKIIRHSRPLGATGGFPQRSSWRIKIISQQEYVMRLRELNGEIALAWLNNERVSALPLTIKVSLWMNYLCQCPVCSPFVEMGLRSFREAPCFECNNFESANGILHPYQAIGSWRGCWWTQSVSQFYPTLFILVTDVMDTVGNLVWNRIQKKAEEDEFNNVVASLPGDPNRTIPRILFYS